MPVLAPSTKELLVVAGERLVAQHGLDSVSMIQIGAAAGMGNKSAVQYHFGSKDQLVEAIFEYRRPRFYERLSVLIAEADPEDLRGWMECHVRAVLQQSELEGSYYMSFVARLLEQGRRDLFERVPAELSEPTREFNRRVGSFLVHVPEPLRTRRVATAMVMIIQFGALRERMRAAGKRVLPFAVELADLVDGMVGYLQAPVSPQARRAVTGLDPAAVAWPTYF
jgi:AcrR family transcriptional regulator